MAEDKSESKKTGMLMRALKLVASTDWKSIVVLLTMTGGGAGYAMDWIDDLRASRTQSASYELLATRLEELAARVETCEAGHNEGVNAGEEEAAEKTPSRPASTSTPKPDLGLDPDPDPVTLSSTTEITTDAAAEDEDKPAIEVQVVYEKMRLPHFDDIRQMAGIEEDLKNFIEQVKEK